MAWLTPEVMRMLERILVVSGGIMCIYLGYLLFHAAQLKQDNGGKFRSAVFEFTATKVGPGVFFSLFGAYVLYGSLNHPIKTDDSQNVAISVTDTNDLAALGSLTTLAQKLPTPEDRQTAEDALRQLRPKFTGTKRWFWGSSITPTTKPEGG